MTFSLIFQVHILRNFTGVDIARYQEAIAKQSMACPRIRRQIIDPAVNSPAPCAFLSSSAASINQHDISKDLFGESSTDEDGNKSLENVSITQGTGMI